MTYVIAEPCVDVLDRACVEECRSTASTKENARSTSIPTSVPTEATVADLLHESSSRAHHQRTAASCARSVIAW
jgi:hypothetical protein